MTAKLLTVPPHQLPHAVPILLLETDIALAEQMATDLRGAGFEPLLANNPTEGWAQIQATAPALVVLDPEPELGLVTCRHLRQWGYQLPVLLLVSQDLVKDRVAYLDAGADDYLCKPYRREALLQLVQLYSRPHPPSGEQLQFDTLSLDLGVRVAQRNGRLIELTVKEFELLKYLMESPRQVLSRDQILENVWGDDFTGESNVIEVYIRYLRLKLEESGEKRLIHTVRGVGYVLREG
jgi:two-component system, OmpR family, response regulator NblR